jgi:hypothetical protein
MPLTRAVEHSYGWWAKNSAQALMRKVITSSGVWNAYVWSTAYSAANLPLIPQQSCHLFPTKVATDSTANLPSIPGECCH